MDKIEIYWGADKDFEEATESLENINFYLIHQTSNTPANTTSYTSISSVVVLLSEIEA